MHPASLLNAPCIFGVKALPSRCKTQMHPHSMCEFCVMLFWREMPLTQFKSPSWHTAVCVKLKSGSIVIEVYISDLFLILRQPYIIPHNKQFLFPFFLIFSKWRNILWGLLLFLIHWKKNRHNTNDSLWYKYISFHCTFLKRRVSCICIM